MSTSFITIDGSQGEGGGQILRSALGLSALTGQPFTIENIRAGREKPGLMRQHLTAVNAAAAICLAEVTGAEIGSRAVTFSPGKVKAGEYKFAIGSAGSTTLVLQAVLPALLVADAPSTITLEGGTHNPYAPPVDFLRDAFAAVINRMGPRVDIELDRHGFYPAGGGRWRVTIHPVKKLSPSALDERGAVVRKNATALVAGLPGDIAKRELKKIEKMLGWSADELTIRQLPSDQGPGNIVMLRVESEHVTEVFTSFGQKGIGAEAVAHAVAKEVQAYLASGASVGEHLADQLLIPFAMAGRGSFTAVKATPHLLTNAGIVERFLGMKTTVTPDGARVRCVVG